MDQLPGESDGVQPQDLSTTCTLPSVFDLTRNGEECLLKASSIEGLHVVQPPGWFVSSGTGNRMVLSEDGVDPVAPLPQPGDQIQPDNAFSNTTVTLSYVSRSHVFTGQNPLSQHSQVYGVPISKTFSLHPATYDTAQLVTDPGGAPLCVEMDQPCLQQVSVPVGLAACGNSFELVSPTQVVENVAGLCYLQAPHDICAIQDVESLAFETFKSLQQNNPSDGKISLNLDEMQNGAVNGLWDGQAFDASFPASHITTGEDQHINGNPELLFLISRSDEPVLLQNSEAPVSLAVSLNQNFVGALEDQVLAPVASIDEVKDVFFMPQTASSPCEDNMCIEETTYNTKADELNQEESNQEESNQSAQVEDIDLLSGADKAVGFETGITGNLTGNNIDICKPEQSDERCGLSEIKDDSIETNELSKSSKHVNGDVSAKRKAVIKKELPPRARRGMKLEAIVQNIYPTRYKSAHIYSTKKLQCDDAVCEQPTVSVDRSNVVVLEEACTEEMETEMTTQSQEEEEMCDNMLNESKSKKSTSCYQRVLKPFLAHASTEALFKKTKRGKKYKKKQKISNKSSVRAERQAEVPQTDFRAKSLLKHQLQNKQGRGSVKTKKARTPKRKRKKHKVGQASVFSAQEPEIKLKYANYKGEKRDKRDDTFLPFVRVELKAYSTCTVINYPEESARLNRGKQRTSPVFASGAVPTTPCLQYTRIGADASGRLAPLVCCLCGGSANAMDLGDLYGPYLPDGFRPEFRIQANAQVAREEESSDSDSYGAGDAAEREAPSQGGWTRKARRIKAALGPCQLSHGSAAKRFRLDSVTDWYSPPVVPLEANEYWFHEDCGVWSAGVFLVRGKLYGLDKAVKMAKETICSSCHTVGATLGCIFKGCPNKYHYICAVQSGCVLNEENFSMKCKKHKNKSIKGVSNNKQNSR